MGWLFAVALGMQKKSGRAVWLSLLPIATGHGAAIGLVVAAGVLAKAALPMKYLKLAVACSLFAFGLYRLLRRATLAAQNAGGVSRPYHLVLSDGFRSRRWLHASARVSRMSTMAPRLDARFWTASPNCRLPARGSD